MTKGQRQLKTASVPDLTITRVRPPAWRMDPAPHIFELIAEGKSNLTKQELEIAIEFIKLFDRYDKSCRRSKARFFRSVREILKVR